MYVASHHFLSLYSFIMGIMWFNVFVLIGLLLRKLRFPIMFSAIPLLLLLVLSVLRMFIAIEIPGAVIVLSETTYPKIVNLLRFKVFSLPFNVAMVLVCAWIIGTVGLYPPTKTFNTGLGTLFPNFCSEAADVKQDGVVDII